MNETDRKDEETGCAPDHAMNPLAYRPVFAPAAPFRLREYGLYSPAERAVNWLGMNEFVSMKRLLLPVITLSLLINCGAAEIFRCVDDSGITFSDTPCPVPDADELRTAPKVLNVRGSQLKLETYAWLNLMPSGEYQPGPTSTYVRLNLTVTSSNGKPFPKDVTFGDRGWILVNDAVYAIEIPQGRRDESEISTRATGTPQWSRGADIEVVVKLVVGSKTEQLRSVPTRVVEAY